MLQVLVMVGMSLAAPPVFVVQPLVLSRDVQGPGTPQLLLAAAPQGQVVLVAGQSAPQGSSDNGQYVEKYEDYNEGSKNEGTEDYNEKTESYNEKYEETSEGVEDYNEKYQEEQNETTPSPDYVEKDDDTFLYEHKDYEENAVEGSGGRPEERNSDNRAGKSSDKRETPEGEDSNKQLREEIVLGSQNKGEVTSTPAVVKLAPPLKETEEVQLAPVVYHVSPKELPPVPKK